MENLKDNFKLKLDKNYSFYTRSLANFSELKDEVNSYKENPEQFSKSFNKQQVELIDGEENKRFYGGTPDERRELTSYFDGERLQKVRDEVASDVAHLQIPDARKRIEFHKNRHVFCAERYHNGHRKKAFATRRNKRAPRPVVNIALSMGYNSNIDAEDAAYNCLGGIIFADMLAKQGYAVNVYVVSVSKYYETKDAALNVVKAKDSSTYLDADTLALLASDPRFFRHWVLQFNATSEDKEGRAVPSGFGRSGTFDETKKALQAAGLDFDFMFGKCFSHRKTVKQVTEAVESLQERVNATA